MPRQLDSSLLNARVGNNPNNTLSPSVQSIIQQGNQLPAGAVVKAILAILAGIAQVAGFDLLAVINAFQAALQGIALVEGSVLSAIETTGTAAAQEAVDVAVGTLTAFIDGAETIAATPIDFFGLLLAETFGVLTNQVGSVQNQVNTPVSIPIPLSAHNDESSVVWENCDTDLTITPTTARGAYIRTAQPNQKQTATIIAYKGSGVTAVYFDLIKLDPLTGIATRIYQGANEAANLSTGSSSADYQTLVHTIPDGQQVVVNGGEYWGWQISTVGGNITIRGKTDPNPALTTRPFHRGFVRDSSSVRMPTTLSQSTMDSDYNTLTPYIEFGKVNPVTPLAFWDDFLRLVL